MRNKELMNKVKELATQTLHSREQSSRVMVQIAIIRQAFGVKNDEHEKPINDYERNVVLTDNDIRKEFQKYLSFMKWAIEKNDQDKQREYQNQLIYFIDGVRFFNAGLAEEFQAVTVEYAA